jgi:hypothetical protein
VLSDVPIDNIPAFRQSVQFHVELLIWDRKLALVMIAHRVFMKTLIFTSKKVVMMRLMFVSKMRNA